MTEQELSAYIQAIRPADEAAMEAARRRQAQLAKPPGSLGQLEEISIRLAGVTGQVCPAMGKCRVAVFAADNGVVAEGVSCTPPAVTMQQAVNMTFRKTGMSAMAAAFGDDVSVVDVGIDGDVPPVGVLDRKVRRGTGDIAREDAMTRQQVLDAMAAGMEQAARARADGVTALGIGEMGIGNTTTSAAVLAALTGADIEAVTGRGGGLTDEGFLRKKEVLRQALALHRPDGNDVIGVLAGVGGLDLAAMTGAFLGCAHERVPAAVDGFISIAAALCAVRLCPAVRDVLFLSHDSYEVGYRIAAEALGLQPCVVAMAGATLALLICKVDVDHALEKIEWSTLFFFMALFILVCGAEYCGLMEKIGGLMSLMDGWPVPVVVLVIMWVSAIAAAVMNNVSFTAAMVTVVAAFISSTPAFNHSMECRNLLWWGLALAVCLGGNASLVGAAANLVTVGIAEKNGHQVGFMDFLKYGVPVTLGSMVLASAYILARYYVTCTA